MTATGYIGGDPTKVDVDGWTLGDVLAANAAGELEAVPLGTPAEVLTVVPAEDTDVGWAAGGGGGAVASVFGRVGVVVAAANDYAVAQINGLPAALAAPVPVADSGPVTTGNIVVGVGLPYTALGPEVTVAAVAGDYVGVTIEALHNPGANTLIFDAATRVAAADVNYVSSGTGTPLFNGARPPWYRNAAQFQTPTEVLYQVQPGDVVAGNVTFQAYAAAEGGGVTVLASAVFPLRVWLRNYGQG